VHQKHRISRLDQNIDKNKKDQNEQCSFNNLLPTITTQENQEK
jgi:hypothetical protein